MSRSVRVHSSIPSSHWSIARFLERLGSLEPIPGGGSAAALSGSLGCALGCMVSNILLSRSDLRTQERQRLRRQRAQLKRACDQLADLVHRDAAAYQQLVEAQRKGRRQLLKIRRKAVECPIAICLQAAQAMQILEGLSRRTGPYLGSDIRAGQALLQGAFEAAFAMAQVNLDERDLGSINKGMRTQLRQLRRCMERMNGNS